MKKLALIIAVTFLAITSGYAQEKVLEPVKFGQHWFLQLQGGASYTISENHKQSSFGDVVSPHVALSVGKNFSPVAGMRLQVGGWQSKNYFESQLAKGTYKVNYVQTNVDGLLNLTNLFMGYKAERPFSLIGVAGIGYAHGFKNKDRGLTATNNIVPRLGIQADYRLNDALSLNLEIDGNLYPDDFNGREEGKKYDGMINTLIGLTYNFTKGGYKTADIANSAETKALNDRINEQRALLTNKDSEISRLKRELEVKPAPQVIVEKTKEIREETEVLMNAVVVFRIGSAQLEKNQDINIYNAARYLKDNPHVKVIVTGYADKSTGSAAVNQRISEQRAAAVAKVLTKEYGIAESRITTKASGDKEQLFPTDAWNRVVVFTATGL